MAIGCGNTVFVDPDRDLKDSLSFTLAERISILDDTRSYFEIHIANRDAIDRIRLYAEGPSGVRFQLPLEAAIRQDCFDGETCLSFTLGPGVPENADNIALEVPDIGHRTSQLLTSVTLRGYTLVGEALAGNSTVSVSVDDPLRHHFASLATDGNGGFIVLFPRTFDAVAIPGPCAIAAPPDAPGWTTEVMTPFTLPAAFSTGPDPEACVSVRPTLPKGGGAIGARTVAARAVLANFQHVYSPPVEVAPLVFMPLFDLELPTEERCTEAEDLVRSSIMDAAADISAAQTTGPGAAEIMMLDPVQIANDGGVLCHQANVRSFDGAATAARVEAALVDRFGPIRRIRVAFIYATNLDLDPPMELVTAISALRGGVTGSAHPFHRDLLIAIAPDKPQQFLSPDKAIDWLATDEPSFRGTIKELLKTTWPFRTVVHTDQTIVPLIAEEERGRFREYRICGATKSINPIGKMRDGLMVFDVGPDGPAYTVSLPEQVLVESLGFSVPTVMVRWEGCESLCDRPGPRALETLPWERAPGCS